MADAKEHYESLLAPYYTWMAGGNDFKLNEYREFFKNLNLSPSGSGIAVDLGSGCGFQAVPLAELGFSVWAFDLSSKLLTELKENAKNLSVTAIEDNLLKFSKYSPDNVEVIVCMGDTLTHLKSRKDVQHLFNRAFRFLEMQGLLILSFRDLSTELTDLDRVIPVRSDSNRIVTCFLEFERNHVKVHDIIYEKTNNQWKMRKSFFRKLRIYPEWLKKILLEIGFNIETFKTHGGMVTVIARKQ